MSDARTSSPRRFLLKRVAIVLAAALLGFSVGRTTSSTSAPQAKDEFAVRSHGEAGTEPTRAGIPVGYADTPAGAAAAVATYQRAFASPRILQAGVMKARIEAVSMPDYAAQMLAANTPGRERLAAGPIGAGIASGLKTLYTTIPIGYRVESFTPRRARILTWGFTLLGNASAVEPAAYFGLTHTELVWSAGSWRIAETRGGFGPTPRLGTPPGALASYDVIGLASRLKPYELAP